MNVIKKWTASPSATGDFIVHRPPTAQSQQHWGDGSVILDKDLQFRGSINTDTNTHVRHEISTEGASTSVFVNATLHQDSNVAIINADPVVHNLNTAFVAKRHEKNVVTGNSAGSLSSVERTLTFVTTPPTIGANTTTTITLSDPLASANGDTLTGRYITIIPSTPNATVTFTAIVLSNVVDAIANTAQITLSRQVPFQVTTTVPASHSVAVFTATSPIRTLATQTTVGDTHIDIFLPSTTHPIVPPPGMPSYIDTVIELKNGKVGIPTSELSAVNTIRDTSTISSTVLRLHLARKVPIAFVPEATQVAWHSNAFSGIQYSESGNEWQLGHMQVTPNGYDMLDGQRRLLPATTAVTKFGQLHVGKLITEEPIVTPPPLLNTTSDSFTISLHAKNTTAETNPVLLNSTLSIPSTVRGTYMLMISSNDPQGATATYCLSKHGTAVDAHVFRFSGDNGVNGEGVVIDWPANSPIRIYHDPIRNTGNTVLDNTILVYIVRFVTSQGMLQIHPGTITNIDSDNVVIKDNMIALNASPAEPNKCSGLHLDRTLANVMFNSNTGVLVFHISIATSVNATILNVSDDPSAIVIGSVVKIQDFGGTNPTYSKVISINVATKQITLDGVYPVSRVYAVGSLALVKPNAAAAFIFKDPVERFEFVLTPSPHTANCVDVAQYADIRCKHIECESIYVFPGQLRMPGFWSGPVNVNARDTTRVSVGSMIGCLKRGAYEIIVQSKDDGGSSGTWKIAKAKESDASYVQMGISVAAAPPYDEEIDIDWPANAYPSLYHSTPRTNYGDIWLIPYIVKVLTV